MEKLKELAQQKWFQLVASLLLGISIGAVFYPQSRTEEKLRQTLKEEYEVKEQELLKTHESEKSVLTAKLDAVEQSHKEFERETHQKLESLTIENSQLKQSSRKQKFKLIKPDGTIVEKEFEESNSESSKTVITEIRQEFDEKVKSIEDRWKKVHEERVATLQKEFDQKLEKARSEVHTVEVIVEKEKIVEVNPKSLRPELGVTTDKDVYLHATYPIWGPVFVGGGVSGTTKNFGEARVGFGFEF